ncbi:MAG: tetratricopeptide repeat protein [bacterium]
MRIERVAVGLAAMLLAVSVTAQEPSGLARRGAALTSLPSDSLSTLDVDRQTADQLYAEGRTLESMGRLQGAYEKFRLAYWSDTTHFRSVYQGGRLLDRVGYLDQAHAAYLQAIVIAPDFYPAWASLGILLAREQRSDDAWEAFEGGVKAAPDYASAWRNLGRASAVLGELKTAEESYEKAVELQPEDVTSRVSLALLYSWDWKLAEARTQFREALRRQPEDARAQAGLAWVESQPVGVATPRRALEPDVPPRPPSMEQPGKKPDWAFRAPEPTVEYSELRTRRGIALTQLGRYEEALPELEEAARYGTRDERVYAALGYTRYRLGDDAGSANAYSQAIELAIVPEPWYHINRGAALERSGRFGAAAKEFKKAIKIDERSARAWFALGVLRLDTGDPRRALKSLVKAVRYDSNYGPAHAALGVALLRLDRKEDALLAYRNAVVLMPEDPDIRMSLARLLDAQGYHLEAAQEYLVYAGLVKDDSTLKEWRELALRRAQELAAFESASPTKGQSLGMIDR